MTLRMVLLNSWNSGICLDAESAVTGGNILSNLSVCRERLVEASLIIAKN